MNTSIEQTNQVRTHLDQSSSVLIIIGANPNIDQIASSLSLYLALISKGKQVSIICPTPMTVEFNHLIGVDKINNKANNKQGSNLVISFPYQEGSIEKVSYNIEDNFFNLVIEPRKGYAAITPEAIQYSHTGGNIDLLITIGISKITDIPQDTNIQTLIKDKPLINIDIMKENQNFGKVNYVDSSVSSVSELFISSFSALGMNIDKDIATNLLIGITYGSNNFSSPQTSASTFEAAAVCLKYGAVHMSSFKNNQPIQTNLPQISPKFTNIPLKQTVTAPTNPLIIPSASFTNPQRKIRIFSPKPKTSPSFVPIKTSSSAAPPDWLKPKIYKGSTLL